MTITNDGYVVKLINEIRTELINTLKVDYPTLLFEPETFEGHVVDLVAEKIYNLMLTQESLYNQTPETAVGQALYSFGFLKGLSPNPATPSVATVKILGTLNATVPEGALIKDNQGYTYAVQEETVLTNACADNKIYVGFNRVPDAGTWTLTIDDQSLVIQWDDEASDIETHPYVTSATGNYKDGFELELTLRPTTIETTKSSAFPATPFTQIVELDNLYYEEVLVVNTEAGAYVSDPYRITTLITKPSGITYVYNDEISSTGTAEETDDEFYDRFIDTPIANGNSIEGIKSRLISIINDNQTFDLLEKVKIKEHYTLGATGAPSALEVFVSGAVTRGEEIARQLRLNLVSAGIQLLGDESYTVTDSDGETHQSKFSYVTKKDIYVNMRLKVTVDYAGDDVVKDALVRFGNSLGVGEDVIRLPGVISALYGIDGINDVVYLKLSDDNIYFDETNISIDDYEESNWTTANISLTTILV